MKIRHLFSYTLAVVFTITCHSAPAVAGEGDSVELVIGSTNLNLDSEIEEVDETGSAYSFVFDNPFRSGRVSGNIGLARLAGDLETWAVDIGARLNLFDNTTDDGDPKSRGQAYLGVLLGGVWTDKMNHDEEVAVGEEEVTVTIEQAEQFLRFGATAGGRLYFNTDRTIGIGGEIEYGAPLDSAVDIESTRTGKFYLILPTGPTAP